MTVKITLEKQLASLDFHQVQPKGPSPGSVLSVLKRRGEVPGTNRMRQTFSWSNSKEKMWEKND